MNLNINFLYIIQVVIFIYIIIGFLFNFVSGTITIITFFVLIATYFLTKSDIYNITDKQWKFFAVFGTIVTVISLLINGINSYKNNSLTDIQNLTNFYKYSLDITKNMENTFMQYPNELGYLFNDIYGVIGRKPTKDYSSTRDLDLEYFAALKIIRGIEALFLRGTRLYGVERMTEKRFQGMASTVQTILNSKLMKKYWTEVKHMINDTVANIIDKIVMFGRFGTLKTYQSKHDD